MDHFFRFAHPWLALVLVIITILIAFVRFNIVKPITLRYSLVSSLKKNGLFYQGRLYKIVPFLLRFSALILLSLLVARPQWVNTQSKITTEGIDIMMVLDASGSMQCFDDLQDRRPRFEAAKQEAIRFIEKRDNDPIGLVIFGKEAISRCPLTLDKGILKTIINDLHLGDINPDGTVLSIAMSMAAKRLKDSKAKSKIMIVLTDGEPTEEIDLPPKVAVDLAKKLGIKIYTIGIGDPKGSFFLDPLFGPRSIEFTLNVKLLQEIAKQTGGKFFLAKNPHELKQIYDIIDSLERTSYELPLFTAFYELAAPFLLVIVALLGISLLATSFLWFAL